MDFFLIMVAPLLIIVMCIAGLFIWGAKSKEPYQ